MNELLKQINLIDFYKCADTLKLYTTGLQKTENFFDYGLNDSFRSSYILGKNTYMYIFIY